ncbi:MAG TPA: plastocyanin/azurin family copper-binding protein [Terriglobales bacterium]|nr:plastocyanin/azurin family copper-binding protein [Terriglobales bacterium]
MPALRFRWVALGLILVCLFVLGMSSRGLAGNQSVQPPTVRQIMVPDEDRFTPFAITVRVGQKVQWINNDTDDHTVVSNDVFNTAGHRGVNVLLPANGGTYTLTFNHPGVFPFYCRFHAMLDQDHQPIAPGPDGGIQDMHGNFGTPMNGVVTVLSQD